MWLAPATGSTGPMLSRLHERIMDTRFGSESSVHFHISTFHRLQPKACLVHLFLSHPHRCRSAGCICSRVSLETQLLPNNVRSNDLYEIVEDSGLRRALCRAGSITIPITCELMTQRVFPTLSLFINMADTAETTEHLCGSCGKTYPRRRWP